MTEKSEYGTRMKKLINTLSDVAALEDSTIGNYARATAQAVGELARVVDCLRDEIGLVTKILAQLSDEIIERRPTP
jgi:hypothetical protein